MKFAVFAAVGGILCAGSASALSVTPTSNAAALAAATVQAGGGVSVVAGSESVIGTSTQQGTYTGFSQGPSGSKITIADGVVLTSGDANFSTTENTVNNSSVTASTGSNAALSGILSAAGLSSNTNDQNVLSFSFTLADPALTSIRGDFIFATDEFPTQSVTDVLGVFVNGTNYAFFPNGNLVSNQQGVNSGFFNSNPVGTTTYGLEWNGITNVLTFEAPVMAGINTFALAIADTQDTIFDSVVFFSGLRQSQSSNGGGGGIIDPPGVIPLPATAWLLLSGVAGLAAVRRRQRA